MTTFNHSSDTFAKVWRGLQAGRFITKEETVGGTEFKYWRHILCDLTDQQLLDGLKKTTEFTGYLTWGEFKKLCVDKPEKPPAYFVPLPKTKMLPAERQARLRQIRAELGI